MFSTSSLKVQIGKEVPKEEIYTRQKKKLADNYFSALDLH